MTNMSIQPLWLTHFIEILLVHEFQLKKFIVGAFSYKAILDPKFPLMKHILYRWFFDWYILLLKKCVWSIEYVMP